MKHLLFVCEGLADEALEDLNGRTPLEAAKTPVMDSLAQKGRVGQMAFVPPGLEPMADIAMLSVLGYDPLKYYTGLAPLEAPAFGLEQDENEVFFRADLVSQLDEVLMDAASGGISEREASILLGDLSAHLSGGKFHFRRGHGYKNFVTVKDGLLLEELDELECTPPGLCLGQKIAKHLPKGKSSDLVIALMKEAGAFLDNHEINRVRIDLGENPANRLWLWGQGKRPHLPLFEKQYGLRGACHSPADFMRGLSKLTGMALLKETPKASDADFALFYFGSGLESRASLDLKSKVKRIEEFDVFVGNVLKSRGNEAARIAVTGDVAESLLQKCATHNPSPLVVAGEGIASGKHAAFNEKICAQTGAPEKGHEFLPAFFKN